MYRKYAGAVLEDGGFVQVAYDSERFQRDIDDKVIGVTRNRHVGEQGYIIHYTYPSGIGTVAVQLECRENPKEVLLTFVDQGIPYNPLDHEDPDITLPVEEREIGGLGILVVKKSVDDITYEYKDGRNILRIRKVINKQN